MESVPKWLPDPNAEDYPFPYQIGDRLKLSTKNNQGTVQNAKYADQARALMINLSALRCGIGLMRRDICLSILAL
jgi:hypothetical protein